MKKFLLIFIFILTLAGCQKKAPVIESSLSLGQDIINVNETHYDAGCNVVDGAETIKMDVIENTLNNEVLGDYFITYHKVYKENDYVCKRLVKVVDTIAPTLTLNNGVDTVFVNETHVDTSITVSDNYDTEFTIITTSNVDTSNVGTYTITYTVTDSNLNTSTITRFVNVINK